MLLIQAGEPIHNHTRHDMKPDKINRWLQSITLSTQVILTPDCNLSSCHLATLHPFEDPSLPLSS